MAIRYKALTELYQETQRSVTAPDQWRAFLASACRFFVPRLNGTLRSCIPFAFRAVSLQAAPDVFCVLHAVLLPSITPACIGSALLLSFFPPRYYGFG